jgi:replicative DNA helicase
MADKPLGYDELLIGTALQQGPVQDYFEGNKLPVEAFERDLQRLVWHTVGRFYAKYEGMPDAAAITDIFEKSKHKKKTQANALVRRIMRRMDDHEADETKVKYYVEKLKEQHEDAQFRRDIKQTVQIRKTKGLQAAKEFMSSACEPPIDDDDEVRTIDLIDDQPKIRAGILHKRDHPEDIELFPLGIEPLDAVLHGGLAPEELMLIAGISSGGKSIGMQDISVSAAENVLARSIHQAATGQKTHLFTIEMSAEQTSFRDYTRISDVPTHKFRNPEHITDAEIQMWDESVARLAAIDGAKIKVTGIPEHASTHRMRAHLEKMRRLTGWNPDIIIVDYAGIMRPSDQRFQFQGESDWKYISQNVKDLKDWAKSAHKPVISAIQLHSSAEGQTILDYNHIAQSKVGIAQHADIILAIIPVSREEAEALEIMRWQWLKAREGSVDEFGRRITFTDLRPDLSSIRIHRRLDE